MATVLDLTDDWNAIEPRDAAYRLGGVRLLNALFPLTDPCYDAPVMAGLSGIGPGAACNRHLATLVSELQTGEHRSAATSGRRCEPRSSRASLARQRSAPGTAHARRVVSDRSSGPHFHVAGASLPGCPGIVLGHNESLAWGATNGT